MACILLFRTTKRAQTFYDGAESSPKGVCHIPMATPFCERTRQVFFVCMSVKLCEVSSTIYFS